jgi:hypothetical protein
MVNPLILGSGLLAVPALLSCPIYRIAWKGNSPKFALRPAIKSVPVGTCEACPNRTAQRQERGVD